MIDFQDHAKRWATNITSDTEATVDLFADEFIYDDGRDADHVYDTATYKPQLRQRIEAFANDDAANGLGVHRFDVREAIETAGRDGHRAVTILWDWTGDHLANYRGIPVPSGKTLTARGQTWHEFDENDKVVRESTYFCDTPVFQELGLPVITPEYWVEGFDFSTLG
jgi:steroid delta-isomerase-like uncharacterized protein